MSVPDPAPRTPRHVAIIMDGNGRWAARRRRPRVIGHRAGARAVNLCVDVCLERGVEVLTLFAFSSENWGRPADEVGALMKLFLNALDREVAELHRRGVRVRFIGDARWKPDQRRMEPPGADRGNRVTWPSPPARRPPDIAAARARWRRGGRGGAPDDRRGGDRPPLAL